jgi:hypothetical protein
MYAVSGASKNYAVDLAREFWPQKSLQVSPAIAINWSIPYEFVAPVVLQAAPKNTVTTTATPDIAESAQIGYRELAVCGG